MKFLYFVATLVVATTLVSCKKETIETIKETVANNELTGLSPVTTFSQNSLIVELFTPTGTFKTGYNDVYYRVKDSVENKYILTASLVANPEMNMMSMSHGCPTGEIQKIVDRPNMYRGSIIFTMPTNNMEGWTLAVNVTQGNTTRVVSGAITVNQAPKRNLNVFEGSDGTRYILAMEKPVAPIVGLNDITAQLYKRIDGYTYEVVPNFLIKIDPRMPSMGNHSSPNNIDLSSNISGALYTGKVALTMTGYWKINLQVLNADNDILKGEAITDTNESSSIYFEIEF